MIGYAQLNGHGPSLAFGHKKVSSMISKDPQFIALRAKVDAAATVADKLEVLDVKKGLYNPFAPANPDKALRIRTVLTRIVIEDAAEKAGLHTDVECVLNAALSGVPDSFYYGVVVPEGASVQRPEICDTKMNIEEALREFQKPYPKAAEAIAQGIAAAVPAKYSDYKNMLINNFKKRFTENLNPFENPFTKYASYIALGAVGLFILSRIGRR